MLKPYLSRNCSQLSPHYFLTATKDIVSSGYCDDSSDSIHTGITYKTRSGKGRRGSILSGTLSTQRRRKSVKGEISAEKNVRKVATSEKREVTKESDDESTTDTNTDVKSEQAKSEQATPRWVKPIIKCDSNFKPLIIQPMDPLMHFAFTKPLMDKVRNVSAKDTIANIKDTTLSLQIPSMGSRARRDSLMTDVIDESFEERIKSAYKHQYAKDVHTIFIDLEDEDFSDFEEADMELHFHNLRQVTLDIV